MTDLALVSAIILLAASDPVNVLAVVATTAVTVLGGLVGWRNYKAKEKVDQVTLGLATATLGLTTTDKNVEWLTASLARADIDRETQDRRHAETVDRMQKQIDGIEERLLLDNQQCDDKLRQLGTIVKTLGGEVPDELVGLHVS